MRLGKLEIFTNGIQRAGQHPKQAPPAAHHSAEHSSFFSALLAFLSTISLLPSLFSSASFHVQRAPKPISRPCPPPMRPVHGSALCATLLDHSYMFLSPPLLHRKVFTNKYRKQSGSLQPPWNLKHLHRRIKNQKHWYSSVIHLKNRGVFW